MKGRDRQQRPQPARQGPNRQVPPSSGPPAGASGTTPGAADGGKTVDQVVADAVRKGYQVVEENIRQGRAAAERVRAGSYGVSEIPSEIRTVANRLLTLGMELGTIWFQLIAAVMRDPKLRTAFEEDLAPRTAPTVRPVSPPVAYRVRCSREVEHSLSLHPLSSPAVPAVAGLYSIEPNAPSISRERVTFRRNPDDSLLVQINVPDEIPAGTYNGVLIDRDTHEPIGTLRLRILA